MGLHGQPRIAPLSWTTSVMAALAVMSAYFLAARLSLALLEKPDGVAVFWPAAGLASGLLIVMGSAARWPVILGVMAATIWANLLGDRNVWSSLFSAVANASEAATVAGLIELGEAIIRAWSSPLLRHRTAGCNYRGIAGFGHTGNSGLHLVPCGDRTRPYGMDSLGRFGLAWDPHGRAARDRLGIIDAQCSAEA